MCAARRTGRIACMLKLILALHIAAGVTSLASMWIPMFAKKGALLHRRAGKVFVGAMATVSVTSLMLAGARFLFDPSPEGQRAGLFLLFVSILTGASVSTGVRVLRTKNRVGPHLHWWDLGLAALLTASSVAMMIYGIATGATLFATFAVIGLVNGGGQLAYWLRNPRSPMHWWFEHMSSMLGACIAATTAFLVVNAERWGLGTFSIVVWLAPSIVGVPVIAIWTAYYRHLFSGRRNFRPTTSAKATVVRRSFTRRRKPEAAGTRVGRLLADPPNISAQRATASTLQPALAPDPYTRTRIS